MPGSSEKFWFWWTRFRRSLSLRLQRVVARLRTEKYGGQVPRLGHVKTPLKGRFCPNPFRQIDLEEDGTAFACCSAWLPTPMGNLKHKPLMELWNGHAMQKIRASIYDGSFRYCRHDRCPVMQNNTLPPLP